jgi:hypothetical protein
LGPNGEQDEARLVRVELRRRDRVELRPNSVDLEPERIEDRDVLGVRVDNEDLDPGMRETRRDRSPDGSPTDDDDLVQMLRALASSGRR